MHFFWFVLFFLIYKFQGGGRLTTTKHHWMVPPAIEASGGVSVLNVVWRIDVSCREC